MYSIACCKTINIVLKEYMKVFIITMVLSMKEIIELNLEVDKYFGTTQTGMVGHLELKRKKAQMETFMLILILHVQTTLKMIWNTMIIVEFLQAILW